MRRDRIVSSALVVLAALAACGGGSDTTARGTVQPTPAHPTRFALGRAVTAEEIAAWDVDVNPKGEGLPAGSGTAATGAAVYATKCASCHGANGEGIAPNPKLVGREPRTFAFADSVGYVKTIGNYWPYATTLFDYIRRAMPQSTPGSLTADETYAVIAWLLAQNEIITAEQVIDATSLPKIVMPSRDRFVRDDRKGGPGFR
jgi:S-disulfanyl-L-cysteine oxidoreductase SoxD